MKVFAIQRKDDGKYVTFEVTSEEVTGFTEQLHRAAFFNDVGEATNYARGYLDRAFTYIVRDYTLVYSGVCYLIDKEDE